MPKGRRGLLENDGSTPISLPNLKYITNNFASLKHTASTESDRVIFDRRTERHITSHAELYSSRKGAKTIRARSFCDRSTDEQILLKVNSHADNAG